MTSIQQTCFECDQVGIQVCVHRQHMYWHTQVLQVQLQSRKSEAMGQRLIVHLVVTLQGLGVTLIDGYKRIKVEEPAKRKGGVMVASVAELMDKLKNEAKVL